MKAEYYEDKHVYISVGDYVFRTFIPRYRCDKCKTPFSFTYTLAYFQEPRCFCKYLKGKDDERM